MQPEDRSDGLEHFEDADDEDGNDGDRDGQAVDAPKDIIIKVDLPSSDGEEEQGSDESDDDKEEGADDTTAKPPGRDAKAQGQLPKEKCYDMRKREPIFAGAEGSAWWELAALAGHVHPSVAAMARTLLSGAPVVYDGNPLQDMALTPFLDKFIQKKAKVRIVDSRKGGGSPGEGGCSLSCQNDGREGSERHVKAPRLVLGLL